MIKEQVCPSGRDPIEFFHNVKFKGGLSEYQYKELRIFAEHVALQYKPSPTPMVLQWKVVVEHDNAWKIKVKVYRGTVIEVMGYRH